MHHILITGGTGFVGQAMIRQLVQVHPDWSLHVPTRLNAHQWHAHPLSRWPQVRFKTADVHDASSAPKLMAGMNGVVHLVAILHGTSADFERVHMRLCTHLAQAAQQAGVERVVHVSALGVPDVGAGDAPSDYLRTKAAGEAIWRSAFAHTDDLRILRPSVIFGEQDRFTNLFAQLLRWSPMFPVPGADALLQPVWVEDVAAAICRLLEAEAPAHPVVQAAGPKVLRMQELIALIASANKRKRWIWPLPDPLAQVQARVLQSLPGPRLMSVDNLHSLQVPSIANSHLPGLGELGITPQDLGQWLEQRASA
jgi:uncharacterized protein YbjT (DUF2867 family)